MLNLVQFISLLLMIGDDLFNPQQPSTSAQFQQELQQETTEKISLFSQWGVGEDKVLIPVFQESELEDGFQSKKIKGQSKKTKKGFINEVFPFLTPILEKKESVPSYCSWEDPLRKISNLFSFLNIIESESVSLFNQGKLFLNIKKKKNDPNCLINVFDLKILANILFDYDANNFNFTECFFFPPLLCVGDNNSTSSPSCTIPSSSHNYFSLHPRCLTVSATNPNCFLPCDFSSAIFTNLLDRIRRAYSNIPPGSFLFYSVFFNRETPCCRAIHQAVSLLIIRKPDGTFQALYCDPSGRPVLPFIPVLFEKTFPSSSFISVFSLNKFQISEGMPDDFSGLLALINTKFIIEKIIEISDGGGSIDNQSSCWDECIRRAISKTALFFDITANLRLHTDGYASLQKKVRGCLVEKTIFCFQKKLLINLKLFGYLFSREREKIYANRKDKNKNYTFLKSAILEEQEIFEKIYTLFIKDQEKSREIEDVQKSFSFIKRFKKSISFFSLDFPSINTYLKEKLAGFDQLETDFSTFYPSFFSKIATDLPLPPDLVDINVEPFYSLTTPSSSKDYISSQHQLITKTFSESSPEDSSGQPSPFIEENFETSSSSSLQTKPIQEPDSLRDLVFFFQKIKKSHWNNPLHLFSKSFYSTRMLSASKEFDEGEIIARLNYGFYEKRFFLDLSQCFINQSCSHSINEIGEFKYPACFAFSHSRDIKFLVNREDHLLAIQDNPLIIKEGLSRCSSVNLTDENLKIIQDYLTVYLASQETKPLVLFGRCVTTCCRAIHQAWTIVVFKLEECRAFYYNPLGHPASPKLLEIIKSIFGKEACSFVDNSQQPISSLDFSGVLSIHGAKIIVDAVTSVSSFSQKIETIRINLSVPLLSINSPKSNFDHQNYFKDHLVVTALKQLFARYLNDASRHVRELKNLCKIFSDLEEQKKQYSQELDLSTNLLNQLKESFLTITKKHEEKAIKKILSTTNFLENTYLVIENFFTEKDQISARTRGGKKRLHETGSPFAKTTQLAKQKKTSL